MFIHCKLAVVILALTLDGRVFTGRIIGGHEAKEHSRPYMVILERQVGHTAYCGGFLLNEDFVMTAAHCQASSITVLLGVHNRNNNKEIQHIPVEQAFPHKDYIRKPPIHDVMLLKLSSKANFSDNVGPIAIADHDDGSLPKSCVISGWGQADRAIGHMTNELREVSVTLINYPLCTEEKVYCSQGDAGPGKGDSGGPLICEGGKAYGVVSSTFTPESGGSLIHTYTKIPDYRSWITSTITKALKKDLMHATPA